MGLESRNKSVDLGNRKPRFPGSSQELVGAGGCVGLGVGLGLQRLGPQFLFCKMRRYYLMSSSH